MDVGAWVVGGFFVLYGLFWVITFIWGVHNRPSPKHGGYSGEGDSWVSEDRG